MRPLTPCPLAGRCSDLWCGSLVHPDRDPTGRKITDRVIQGAGAIHGLAGVDLGSYLAIGILYGSAFTPARRAHKMRRRSRSGVKN